MAAQTVGRRLVVVRRDGEQTVRAEIDCQFGELDCCLRRVAASAGENGNATIRAPHGDLHDAAMLAMRQRRILAGRSAGHEEVGSFVDLKIDEPLEGRFVERSIGFERRDQRHADTAKLLCIFHDITIVLSTEFVFTTERSERTKTSPSSSSSLW